MPRRKRPVAKLGDDSRWHVWVTVGTKPNGRPDQRHISRATRDQAEDDADELLDTVKQTGAAPKAGKKPTVDSWLKTYLDTVAPRKVDPTTIHGYRSKMRLYVSPVCGAKRLDRLDPTDLDRVYLRMQERGLADSTIRQTHRILSRALEVAYRRGLTARNVAKLIDAPTAKAVEMQSLTEEAAAAILGAAARRRNAARWSVGLALGLRQGEALGLRWPYVDLDAGEMRVWWQLHRRPWEHGCSTAAPKCGRRRGGNCPQRKLTLRSGEIHLTGGLILKEPKGKSKRTVPIPPELVVQLRAHREVQDLERQFAVVYAGHDLVFARADGAPVDPGDDWSEWKALLGLAGVPDARVHDARHTAATLLLAQGVRLEVVQEILGHSSITVTRGYAHVASKVARAGIEALGKKLLRGAHVVDWNDLPGAGTP